MFPYKVNTSKHICSQKQPWMTYGLLKSCKKKSRLYLKYLKNPTETNKKAFTKFHNVFKKANIAADKLYYANRFSECENDLRKTWRNIRSLLNCGNNFRTSDIFTFNDVSTSDKSEVANRFNDYL